MNLKDCEFLDWLANRLTNKYQEDIEISEKIKNISLDMKTFLTSVDYFSGKEYTEVDNMRLL